MKTKTGLLTSCGSLSDSTREIWYPQSLRAVTTRLPAPICTEICRLLNQSLADCIDLERRAIQAEWNTSGPDADLLVPWFEDLRDTSRQAAERIARRITDMGGEAEATIPAVAERSGLGGYDLNEDSGRAHVNAIVKALAVFVLALGDDIDLLWNTAMRRASFYWLTSCRRRSVYPARAGLMGSRAVSDLCNPRAISIVV